MNNPNFAGAIWIGSNVTGGPRSSASSPYLRRSFRLDLPVKSASLQVTALGLFECEMNGLRIGREVFSPGWTDYHKTLYYDVYNVTSFLRVGENVLGAILGDGWYCGFVAFRNRQVYGRSPMLLARLEVEFIDGTTLDLCSDSDWKTSTGPILEGDILMGEAYDARLELDRWSLHDFDDSKWCAVHTQQPICTPEVLPRIGPPVRRTGEITPVAHRESSEWTGPVKIYDFGQNLAGRVRINVTAARGRTIRLRHAEMLKPDGRIYTDNLREARAEDSYVCRGNGQEEWEPRFTFHGFRYVEVKGLADEDSLEVTAIVLHSDMEVTGAFSCSNPLLNQLQSNIIWSQKANFIDVPTDCPQRDERMGWTGDAQVFIRTACFNMDVQGFFKKWINDIRDAQHETGGIPCVVPHLDIHEIFDVDGGPAWSDATIICPWTIYLCYGDVDILREHYASMRRFFDFLLEHRCIGLIRSHPEVKGWLGYGDWLALDGSGTDLGGTPKDLIGTAFLAHDAEILAKIAEILGYGEDVVLYRDFHQRIVKAFQNRFVTSDGIIVSGSQTSAVLALHFNLLPEYCREHVIDSLIKNIEKNGGCMGTGFVGTPYLLHVLEDAGRLDVAYKLLEQEAFPSWLFPVINGATTIWERWDAWTLKDGFHRDGMNSFNHYAYGAVGEWMYRTVAGLELDVNEPGYRHIVFRPRPGGTLTWAHATLKTKFGVTTIKWALIKMNLEVKISIPEGAHGTFESPRGFRLESDKILFGPGRYIVNLVRDERLDILR